MFLSIDRFNSSVASFSCSIVRMFLSCCVATLSMATACSPYMADNCNFLRPISSSLPPCASSNSISCLSSSILLFVGAVIDCSPISYDVPNPAIPSNNIFSRLSGSTPLSTFSASLIVAIDNSQMFLACFAYASDREELFCARRSVWSIYVSFALLRASCEFFCASIDFLVDSAALSLFFAACSSNPLALFR